MDQDKPNWGCGHYSDICRTRFEKLVQILGKEWFPGKRVLDVGAGHGMNGRAIMALGSEVLFTDGRQHHVDVLKANGLRAELMDNEQPWTVKGPFDLIIHWGLLYHLNNWKQDLMCAVERAPLVCLETLISKGNDPTAVTKVTESGPDQALGGIGSIMSAIMFENYVTELGCTFTRYDDGDLTVTDHHTYDWDENEGVHNTAGRGQRRYWMIRTGR